MYATGVMELYTRKRWSGDKVVSVMVQRVMRVVMSLRSRHPRPTPPSAPSGWERASPECVVSYSRTRRSYRMSERMFIKRDRETRHLIFVAI